MQWRRKACSLSLSSLGLGMFFKTWQTQHGCTHNRMVRLCLKNSSVKVAGPSRSKNLPGPVCFIDYFLLMIDYLQPADAFGGPSSLNRKQGIKKNIIYTGSG